MKFFTALIILLILLTGCNYQKSNNNSSLDTESIIEESTSILDTVNVTEASEIKADPTDWRSAYREELYNFMDSDEYKYYSEESRFSLYDINGDNIPELFISEGYYYGRECYVYTFTDKLISLGQFGSYGGCSFYPDINILGSSYSGQGEEFDKYYQLDNNGSLIELASFYNNSEMEQVTVEYKVNDVEVTEEEYKSTKEEYYDDHVVVLGHDLKFNKVLIDSLLTESSNWKECYKDLLNGLQDTEDWQRFSLYDINGDDIPELLISNSTNRFDLCSIFCFKNGLMYIDSLGSCGDISYSPSHDLFYDYDIAQGHEYFLYYTLDEDNGFQCEMSLYNNVMAAPTEDDIKYEINHEEVSYDEYKNALDKYSEIDDFIWLGRDYSFTEKDITKVLP